jgi:hypothetical protein
MDATGASNAENGRAENGNGELKATDTAVRSALKSGVGGAVGGALKEPATLRRGVSWHDTHGGRDLTQVHEYEPRWAPFPIPIPFPIPQGRPLGWG